LKRLGIVRGFHSFGNSTLLDLSASTLNASNLIRIDDDEVQSIAALSVHRD
jgi:predicted dienelactone hydrolase